MSGNLDKPARISILRSAINQQDSLVSPKIEQDAAQIVCEEKKDQKSNKVKVQRLNSMQAPVLSKQSEASLKNPGVEVVKIPDVSLDCLEAIELLLKKDPRERITLFEFLHHPWMQSYQKWKNKKRWNDCYSSDSNDSLKDELNI